MVAAARRHRGDRDWPSAGLRHLALRKGRELWRGLAVLRSLRAAAAWSLGARGGFAQIFRNWLLLRAVGVDASFFDAIAVLIAVVTLGQLPVGPGVGAAAAVLILGSDGVAAAAAAGVLMTVTGTIGGLVLRCLGRPGPPLVPRGGAGLRPSSRGRRLPVAERHDAADAAEIQRRPPGRGAAERDPRVVVVVLAALAGQPPPARRCRCARRGPSSPGVGVGDPRVVEVLVEVDEPVARVALGTTDGARTRCCWSSPCGSRVPPGLMSMRVMPGSLTSARSPPMARRRR